MIESGFEADRLRPSNRAGSYRWWLYVQVEGEQLRDQRARKGVADNGFRFARGGRAYTPEECRFWIGQAELDAVAECQMWMRQPSHLLGPAGQLIPLDQVESLEDLRELAR